MIQAMERGFSLAYIAERAKSMHCCWRCCGCFLGQGGSVNVNSVLHGPLWLLPFLDLIGRRATVGGSYPAQPLRLSRTEELSLVSGVPPV